MTQSCNPLHLIYCVTSSCVLAFMRNEQIIFRTLKIDATKKKPGTCVKKCFNFIAFRLVPYFSKQDGTKAEQKRSLSDWLGFSNEIIDYLPKLILDI